MSQRIAKYEILEKIAEGGFGTVYKARDPFIKRLVAIKTCSVADQDMARRFFREAEIAGRFDHPNVTIVHDFGVEEQLAYLVQEYLPGEDLLQKIRRRDPLSVVQKIDYLLQVAAGLAYAHSKEVIHRDIKPANLRVLENGQVKILDFGIAKLVSGTSQLTQKGVAVGTLGYLSPEQLRDQELDTRTDIFSFGVVAYELLTYTKPFKGRQLSALMDEILNRTPVPVTELVPATPPALQEVVDRCLEKDRARRYQSFEEVTEDLEAVRRELVSSGSHDLPASADPPGPAAAEPGGGPVTRPIVLVEATAPSAEAPTALSPGAGQGLPPSPPPRPPVASPTVAAAAAGPALAAQAPGSSVAPSAPLGPPRPPLPPALAAAMADPDRGLDSPTVVIPPPPPPPPGAASSPEPPSRWAARLAAPPVEMPREPSAPDALAGMPAPPSSLPPPAAAAPTPTGVPPVGRRGLTLVLVGVAALSGAVLLAGLAWWVLSRSAAAAVTPAPVRAAAPVATRPPAPVAAMASLIVLASPWGELAGLRASDGRELPLPSRRETPLLLSLPPGHYTLTLKHPQAPAPLTCEVDAVAGQAATCRVELVPLDPLQYFKEAGWWR